MKPFKRLQFVTLLIAGSLARPAAMTVHVLLPEDPSTFLLPLIHLKYLYVLCILCMHMYIYICYVCVSVLLRPGHSHSGIG